MQAKLNYPPISLVQWTFIHARLNYLPVSLD